MGICIPIYISDSAPFFLLYISSIPTFLVYVYFTGYSTAHDPHTLSTPSALIKSTVSSQTSRLSISAEPNQSTESAEYITHHGSRPPHLRPPSPGPRHHRSIRQPRRPSMLFPHRKNTLLRLPHAHRRPRHPNLRRTLPTPPTPRWQRQPLFSPHQRRLARHPLTHHSTSLRSRVSSPAATPLDIHAAVSISCQCS